MDQEKESESSSGASSGETIEKPNESDHHKNSLAGFLGHVSASTKNVKSCIESCNDSKNVEIALKDLESAWNKYDNCYQSYLVTDLSKEEIDRVTLKYTETHHEYSDCKKAVNDRLLQLQAENGAKSVKSKSSNASKTSRQSKLREAKRNIEIKKLLLLQEEELTTYEIEMEERKIEMEFERKRRACKMKFEIQLAEKEAEFLEENDCESCSNFSLENKEDLDLLPPLTEQEKIVTWAAGCDKKPLNPTVTEFVPLTNPPKHIEHSDIKKENPIFIPKELKPLPEQKTTSDKEPVGPGCGGTRAESPNQYEVNTALHNQAVMLKLTMLQAMTPVKFTGNPSDFPTFRDRMRDNLEDGILTDSQRIEFLPKFLGGEAYDVIERVSGCSYKTVVDILEDRYGQPATVAAACIENLTNGPKLPNTDYTGLRDFAEQLESASKKLVGSYELEASTMTNLKQIVRRLPGYLVNKWADTSYAIREKGAAPKLSDLAKFVKRQAAIKNDPGFVNPGFTEYKGKPEKQHENSNTRATSFRPNKQTSSFATYFEMDNTDTDNFHSANRPNTPTPDCRCTCCSGTHKLAECAEFQSKDLKARWNIVKQNKLCHVCMESGHMRAICESNQFCRCGNDRRHHKLLHNPPRMNNDGRRTQEDKQKSVEPSDSQGANDKNVQSDKLKSTEQYATVTEKTSSTVLLHVVPVKVIAPNGRSMTTYGILDNASRGTMISKDIAKKLGLEGRKELISVSTLMEKTNEELEVVEFELQSASGIGEIITVEEGLVSEKFNIAEQCLPKDIDRTCHPHLKDIHIPEVELSKVTVLIGKDVDYAHEVFEVRRPSSPDSKLKALRGPLGWVITGTVKGIPCSKELAFNFTVCDKNLHEQIENFWKLEGFGTKSARGCSNDDESLYASHNLSREDKRAVDILQRTTKMCEGHYETGLLWRKDDLQLPKNKPEAERRMRSLKRKFAREPDLETKYRAVMDGYIAKGHARKLSPEEAAKTGPRTWYLPHFSVTNPNKPGKLRIVFDAAAECEGTSLNKNLLHGPDCTNSLVGVLMRFRQENNTVVADIESMFHQVKVQPDDHDSLRFLWWSESVDEPPEDFVMTVHIFGAADSPCSANSTLKRLADDNQKDFDPITIETLRRNFYVDDILKSVPTPSEAIRLAEQLEELCARGGFNLTKFMSNNRQVLAAIPIEKRAAPTLDLDLDELPTDRALGIQWDVESDTFGFKVTNLNKPDTMRGVLSTISSVFDPLNLAAPAMLPAKQIMQTLWRRKLPWDQPLDGEILEKWKKWKSSLPLLQNFRITRCYFSRLDHEGVRLQLHHFCDASEAAYGTATYLRIEYPDGVIECSFIAGKSRNAPIKSVSIPRLELQGALLAARVDHAIRKELDFKFEKVIFWTDSMITLNYIQNETRRFQTYVANRITEIRELTSPDQWRHCPGKLNPADDVSRGLNMEEFLREERWLNGPTFLTECEDRWPENRFEVITVEDLEVKKEIYLTKLEPAATVDDLINSSSQWVDTLRKIAWLLKFIDWLKSRSVKKKELIENDIQKRIGPDDLERSKRHVAILVQRTVYPEEMRNLKEGKRLKASSEILKLKPIMKEDDVMRVGGRISLAPISPDAANPIILPKKHHITTLLIRHLHESNGHCGVEQLLSLLREQFWVVKARVSIKTVLGKCLHCRKQLAPRMHQGMGELPKVRMIPYEPPFTYSGVDYFGPFYVKRGRGRVIEKRWGAIFTCMNSRAVHLEVAKSLETDDFILVLMRFLNRRGQVKELRSDNGTNFVGAEREIRESIEKMDHDKVERELTHRGCKWVFHPPGAAHMSGVWERLVRIVKRSLKAILGNDPMNEEVLNTVFTEAERIANSRPLTRNPSGTDDDEPLTPNHFLNVRPSTNLPPGIVDEKDKFSRKRWRQAQLLANHYWKRWLREYLPSLQVRHKWQQSQRNLQTGAIVLIADDNVPRNQWVLGRVINVFPGADGLVRSVEVRAKGTTFKRPVTKICLLEADNDEI